MAIPFHQQVRLAIYDHILSTGNGPGLKLIAETVGAPEPVVADAFDRLGDSHLIYVNHETGIVQMAWPLSGIPTPYSLNIKGVQVYANCAWDLLGIPAMLDIDAEFTAACAQTGEMKHFHIKDGKLILGEGLIHFVVRPGQWYKDLVYTCATIHLFRSEEPVEQWCASKQLQRGAVLAVPQVWELSKPWYRPRLNPDYEGRSAAQIEAIFQQVGLVGDFWKLDHTSG